MPKGGYISDEHLDFILENKDTMKQNVIARIIGRSSTCVWKYANNVASVDFVRQKNKAKKLREQLIAKKPKEKKKIIIHYDHRMFI